MTENHQVHLEFPGRILFVGFGSIGQGVLPLIGGGETRFQPVYVGDVADAVVACLEDPATAGRIEIEPRGAD